MPGGNDNKGIWVLTSKNEGCLVSEAGGATRYEDGVCVGHF